MIVLLALFWAAALPQDTTRLSLDEAVRLAVLRAPSLDAARQVLAGAESARRQASSQWWPQFGADAGIVTYEEPSLIAPIHSFRPTAIPPFEHTLTQGSVSGGWTLFDGGIRRGQIAQASALEDAARAGTHGTEQTLIAAVVRAYAEVRASREALDAQDRRRESLEAEAARVGRFLKEGRASQLDRLRADAAVAGARADRAGVAGRLEVAEAGLARLIGSRPEEVRSERLLPIRYGAAIPEPRDSLLIAARAASPALQAALSRVAAAQAAVKSAGGVWFPSLKADGRLVTYGSTGGHYTTEWQAGLRASWPIFTGGNRGAAVDRARALAAQTDAEYRDADLALANQIDRALASLTEAGERIEALEAAVGQLAEAQRVERLALDQGAGTQTDFLRAEADLAGGRAALADARAARIAGRVELERLAGRLTAAALATLVTSQPETGR